IAFAREGADIAFSYLSEDVDAEETLKCVEQSGRKACAYAMDQQSEEACSQLVTEVVREFGRLDILVNNAAFQGTYDGLNDISSEEFDRAFRTNVYGTFFLSR